MQEQPRRDILQVSMDKVDDIRFEVEHFIGEKVNDVRDKVGNIIDEKLEEGKIDESTLAIGAGAGKITYGLVRGGLAVAGALGHGVAGFFMRRHNPAAAAKLLQQAFEAAGQNIQEGAELLKEGINERRKK